MTPQGHIPSSAVPGAHEDSDLNIVVIRRTTGIIFVLVLLIVGATFILLRALESRFADRTSEAAPPVTSIDLPPEPRLQTHPFRDLQQVRVAEDLHLNHYGWIDRPQGLAQVPIDRAMDLWLKTSLDRSTTNPGALDRSENRGAQPVTELQMRQQKAQEATHVP